MLAADFLEANFDKVFGHYQKLLHSENYVTRRQSLKLLGELLLDRHNFSVSQRKSYVIAAADNDRLTVVVYFCDKDNPEDDREDADDPACD